MPSSSKKDFSIISVERALEDLRRGLPVMLVTDGKASRVVPGEYAPEGTKGIMKDAAHPAVQLMKLAGLLPLAVVEEGGQDKELLSVSAEAVASYPAALASTLRKVSEAQVPLTVAENTRVIAFRPRYGHEEHLAILIGAPEKQEAPLVRVHSSCVTGDVLGSMRCDCGDQLHRALEVIAKRGGGAVLYLNQEGRGIGIASKLRAYKLQDGGMDTVAANEALGYRADERDFALAAEMLKQLGLGRITLLTNNPAKAQALGAHGIAVAGLEPLIAEVTEHNRRYLEAKEKLLGHKLSGN